MDKPPGNLGSVNATLEHRMRPRVMHYLPDGTEQAAPHLRYIEQLCQTLGVLEKAHAEANKDTDTYSEALQKVSAALKESLGELNSLIDLLALVQKTDYFVIEEAPQEFLDVKPWMLKEVLYSVSHILRSGHRRLMRAINATALFGPHSDFHLAMLYLRRKWLYKKVGGKFICDLSYETCGSTRSRIGGKFELASATLDSRKRYPIEFKIPPALRAHNPVRIIISLAIPSFRNMGSNRGVREQIILDTGNFHSVGRKLDSETKENYVLRCSQSVVFIEELFGILAAESMEEDSMAVGSSNEGQFTVCVAPEAYMTVKRVESLKQFSNKPNHWTGFYLESVLYAMLLRLYNRERPVGSIVCSCSTSGIGLSRETAGLECATVDQLCKIMMKPKFLPELRRYAKHLIYRYWISEILEEASRETNEVKLVSHLNTSSTLDFCAFRVWVTCPRYELLCWNRMIITLAGSEIFIEKSDSVIEMESDVYALRMFLTMHITAHMKSVLVALANSMGYKAIGQSSHVRSKSEKTNKFGFQGEEDFCEIVQFAHYMSSSNMHVRVRLYSPTRRISVIVTTGYERIDAEGIDAEDAPFAKCKEKELDLNSYPSHSDVGRFELLLASLT